MSINDYHKLPPQNIEAEKAVLGAILLEPKVLYDISLKDVDFYRTAHGEIFKAIQKIREKGINLISLVEALTTDQKIEQVGGAHYIASLLDSVVTSAQIKEHANIVRDKAIRRDIARAAMTIFNNIEDTPIEMLAQTMRRALESRPDAQMLGTKHIREIIPGVLEYIERRYNNKLEVSGVPSGFRSIDLLTDGFHPELYILGGRSSHGKSALVKDFTLNAAKAGHPVHFINIEDGNQNTIRRLFAREADVPLWKLRKGYLSKDELKHIYSTAGSLAELPITFDDTIRSAEPILNSIRRAVEEGSQLIIIDYLQLIKGDRTRKRHEEIGEITQELKELCRPSNLNVPIILTCQLLREVDKRKIQKPMISDLRESGDIEIHSDVVFLLHRPAAYNHQQAEEEEAEFIIAKGRNIGTGHVTLTFIAKKTTFYDSINDKFSDPRP